MASSDQLHVDGTASLGTARAATRHDDDHLTLVRRTTHVPASTHPTDDEGAFVEETHAINVVKLEVSVTASKKEAGYTLGVTVPLVDLPTALATIKLFDKSFYTDAFPGGRSPNVAAS